MTVIAAKSETWTYVDGDWHAGNVAIAGPMTHAFWMGSSVFDGMPAPSMGSARTRSFTSRA
jgi:branched-subunit amino acid aminotransferase/4-amino-4-deoxychorismate lyase